MMVYPTNAHEIGVVGVCFQSTMRLLFWVTHLKQQARFGTLCIIRKNVWNYHLTPSANLSHEGLYGVATNLRNQRHREREVRGWNEHGCEGLNYRCTR